HRELQTRRPGLPSARSRLVPARSPGAGKRPGDALGRLGDGADDRRAGPVALAAGGGVGAEVPRRGRGGRPGRDLGGADLAAAVVAARSGRRLLPAPGRGNRNTGRRTAAGRGSATREAGGRAGVGPRPVTYGGRR